MYDISKFKELFSSSPGNEDNHYSGSMQVSHFAAANRMIFTLANICKYVDRYKKKGKPVQDLEKALWYTRFQQLDYDNFTIPMLTSDRITPEELFEHRPEYNEYQKEIISRVFEYNWSGNPLILIEVKGFLKCCISEQENV